LTGSAISDDLYAGIDVGTQGVRVVVTDALGDVRGIGRAPLASRRAGDLHEQDPTSWWTAVAAACRQACSSVHGRIRAVSVCSTSGTFALLDDGEPSTPGLMYNDRRGLPYAAAVRDAGRELWDALGYPMQGVWALPRLVAALADPGPRRLWDSGDLRLAHQGDFINERLVGEIVPTDWAQALKTGYDVEHLRWPTEVFGELGVSADGLPPVVPPGTVIGTVHAEAAEETGLHAGALVVAGTTDSCAAQISAGALEPGHWNSVLGTTLAVKGASEHRIALPLHGVYSHRSPVDGWLPGGASNVGAGFLAEHFGDDVGHNRDRGAARYEPTTGVVYPLVGVGERFPFESSSITAFSTISGSAKDERYAAALQGIAFVERLAYDLLRAHGASLVGPLSVTGGATRSRYWLGLRAAVLDHPVRLPREPQPAFGMAVAARGAHRGQTVVESAKEMVGHHPVIDPEPGRAARMNDGYLGFVEELVARGYLRSGSAERTPA
jgi:sugar (pentulose or hexulose) kinase